MNTGNLVPSNLTLFLTVHFHAVHDYAATHIHITCFILHFHAASILICLSQTVLRDLIQTCTYNTIVYKSQWINWHPYRIWFSWSVTSKANLIKLLTFSSGPSHLLEITWGIYCFRVVSGGIFCLATSYLPYAFKRQCEQFFLCPPLRNLHYSVDFLHSLMMWSLLQLKHLLLLLWVASTSMALGSLVLALFTIPDLIKLRNCFLLPACFRSFLKSATNM